MNISDQNIDGGKPFDWGRTSADYAKFRDIYPQEFYDKIIAQNLCIAGQNILDIGTGTGVLTRNRSLAFARRNCLMGKGAFENACRNHPGRI